jgi:hypothetical protein
MPKLCVIRFRNPHATQKIQAPLYHTNTMAYTEGRGLASALNEAVEKKSITVQNQFPRPKKTKFRFLEG